MKLFKGRFINEIDIKERRKVIVLHKKTAEILFDKTHTEPIGQFVNAGNVVYQVVGLYNDKGDSGDSDAYIPFTTLQTIYNKGDTVSYTHLDVYKRQGLRTGFALCFVLQLWYQQG